MREGVVQEVVNWKDTLYPFMKELNLTDVIHVIIKLHVSKAHLKRHIESVHGDPQERVLNWFGPYFT